MRLGKRAAGGDRLRDDPRRGASRARPGWCRSRQRDVSQLPRQSGLRDAGRQWTNAIAVHLIGAFRPERPWHAAVHCVSRDDHRGPPQQSASDARPVAAANPRFMRKLSRHRVERLPVLRPRQANQRGRQRRRRSVHGLPHGACRCRPAIGRDPPRHHDGVRRVPRRRLGELQGNVSRADVRLGLRRYRDMFRLPPRPRDPGSRQPRLERVFGNSAEHLPVLSSGRDRRIRDFRASRDDRRL